ncbi:MAG: hypothetical protein QXD77_02225 [Candidatus Aenigmatarchaeota archaeon]
MAKANEKREYALAVVMALALAAVAIGGMNALGFAVQQAGTTTVSVQSKVSILLTTTSVNFGAMFPDETNNTLGNTPAPFVLENNGNVKVNVTINATDLWATAANPTANYRFMANSTGEGICYDTDSITTLTNMPAYNNPTKFLTFFNSTNSCDTAEIEIEVTVPTAEPEGAKSSTVTFTASQA